MRVLLGHCYYRSSAPSGEDAVYENEKALLSENGIEVVPFERFNDDIDVSTVPKRIHEGLSTTWSFKENRALRNLIARTRPNIAHFHNTFPQLSPSVYAACKSFSIPVVQTLHNYRLICAGALLQRDSKPCEACVGHLPIPALVHRCYRSSLPATSALVLMQVVNRLMHNYSRLVDQYIALTEFSASRMIAGGLPANKIVVKPNFLPRAPKPSEERENYIVYVGRLSEEKGVRTLVEAWRCIKDVPLKVIGDGPLYDQLTKHSTSLGLNISFLGSIPRDQVLELTRRAALQIVPSEWYEGFPMVVLEAYACGTPVIASAIGSLDEVVVENHTGWKFMPRDPADLARVVKTALSDIDKLSEIGINAHLHYKKQFTPISNFRSLQEIYNRLLRN